MPTNLKSLLSRSRSRNELKSREKEDNESGSNHDENSEDGKVETDVGGNNTGVSPGDYEDDDDGTSLSNPCTSTNETHYSRSNFNESCNRVPQSNTNTSPLEGLFTGGGYTSDGRKMFKSCSTLNQQQQPSFTQTTMTPTLPGLFTNFSKATSPGAAASASSSQSTNVYRDEGKFRCQIEFVGGETDCCGVSNSCSSSGGAGGGTGATYATTNAATQSSSHNYHNHLHNLRTPSPTAPAPSSHFQSSSSSASNGNLPMRKCETVLALSSFSRDNSTSSPSDSVGSTTISSTGSTGKVKLVKDKILSTSSSTLNCLLHSTSRAKLFSSWKLSSSNTNNSSSQHFPTYPDFLSPTSSSSSSGGGPTTGCHASSVNSCNCRAPADPSFHMHNHHHHSQHQQISKSQQQLLLPGNNNFPSSGGLGGAPLTPTNRLRRNISITNACFSLSPNSSYSRSSSVASFCWREKVEDSSAVQQEILCRLCLCNVRMDETVEILGCSCRYCKDCIVAYISFEIQEGAEDIACPDATCEGQGVLTLPEIESLLPLSLVEKHKKFRMYREVEKDGHLMWCPTPGCETVCRIQEATSENLSSSPLSSTSSGDVMLQGSKLSRSSGNRSLIINCTTCQISFCAECKLSWHPGTSCESFRRKLIKQGKLSLDDEELYSLDSIKKCPFCHVPIEKDSGCAQMMCKRCKHVFCWYCLASLDDDFLLRHYDKGPCKNKLGHSRASVVWHRAQVIGIFAGFGVLVLLASPLLILAAPCLLCCRCRYCANKDSEESPVAV